MGRMKKKDKHEMIREDVLAAVDAARPIIERTPSLALGVWTFRQMMLPVEAQDIRIQQLQAAGQTSTPMNDEADALAAIVTRFAASVGPFAALLGLLYQGVQGALTGLATSMLGGTLAVMRFDVIVKNKREDEPFPGRLGYFGVQWIDAIFLSSVTPLILDTLRSQPIERGSII